MRHTLIPAQERAAIHSEYHVRVAIVLISTVAVAVAVGIVALFPAYMSALAAEGQARADIQALRSNSEAEGLSKIETELAADKKLITALAKGSQKSQISELVRLVVATRGPVTISSFTADRQGTSTAQLVLKGVAPARADLLAFKSRLEALAVGTKADLPISDLKKSVNLPFSIKLTMPII